MEKEQTRFSILMFPWLAYSHILPYLELAKRLSKRSFHIYFCSSATNLISIKNIIKKDISIDETSFDLIELQIPSSPELPPHLHTTKNLPPHLIPTLIQAFQTSSSSFSNIMDSLKPDLLIYDFFQPWSAKMASSRAIPSIYFATSGASPFSFFHHLYKHGTTSTFPYQEIYLLERETPDLNAPTELKIRDAEEDSFGFGCFKLSSEIVLIKSLKGIEGKFIDYLSVLCGKRIIPTGPLIRDSNDGDDQESCLEIMNWLSKKEPYSTAFICFGSEHFLSKDHIEEMAKGLEICGANFIWVIREGALLPEGFLDRVEERGRIIKEWAPQAKILSHNGIGGFVSHCGWSSIMESMYFGVPIIAIPIRYDQPINARLVVEAGGGVEVGKDEKGGFCGEEVAKAINTVVAGESGEKMRCRVRDLSERMKEEEEEAMNGVAEELMRLCKESKK